MQIGEFGEYKPVLRLDTDTATPHQPIPMYYIHSLSQPFCRNFNCQCHRKQREIKELLGFIADGIMTLQEAANLKGEQSEGEA